jgi:hypothetical protein
LPSESCEWTPPTSLLPTAEMPRRTAASTERVAASAAGCSPLAVRFLPDSRPSAARRSRPNAPAAMRPPWFPVYFVNLSSNLALNAVREHRGRPRLRRAARSTSTSTRPATSSRMRQARTTCAGHRSANPATRKHYGRASAMGALKRTPPTTRPTCPPRRWPAHYHSPTYPAGSQASRLSAVTLLSRGVAHVIDQALAWFCSTGWSPWLSW